VGGAWFVITLKHKENPSMMKARLLLAALISFSVAGCTTYVSTSLASGSGKTALSSPRPGAAGAQATEAAKTTEETDEAEIRENLASLNPEDRKLAEAQKYCAVQTKDRLGEMGPPVKIMLKDQPVFLCCGHCKKDAEKDPDKTLATVAQLKQKAADETKKK
jgi:hypothetical protein